MARETLSLFKTFEELPTNRGPILSHFGFFFSFSNLSSRLEFQIEVPKWFALSPHPGARSSLSLFGYF